MALPVELQTLAARQHGVVARRQVLAAGVSSDSLRHHIRTGALHVVGRGVVQFAGSPAGEASRRVAAVLGVSGQAAVSHASSLRMWGVPGSAPWPLDVAVLQHRASRRDPAVVLHRLRALPPELITKLDGVPIVRPELALYQYCGVVHPERAERAIDKAWALRLVSGRSMDAALGLLAKRGRNGTALYRMLVRERGDDYEPPASNLESRVAQILREAFDPPLRRQVDVGGSTWTGRVDFLDERLPLVVEVQSERYHGALSDARDDRRRIAQLEADGFLVLTLWDNEIWTQPGQVLAKVRAAREQAIELRYLQPRSPTGLAVDPNRSAEQNPSSATGSVRQNG